MEQTRRDSFRSRWGFKLACIGSAVGMGNIWLFPSRMSAYGGATFLIPYVIFVVLIASTGVIGQTLNIAAIRAGMPAAAAGLTAGLYLARARYRVLVVEKERFGGQAGGAGARLWASSRWRALWPWPSAIPWWLVGF